MLIMLATVTQACYSKANTVKNVLKPDTATINVKTAGAAGNGTQDDYAPIAKALSQTTGPVKVYFPAGTYLLKRTLSTAHDGTVFTFDKNAKFIIDDSSKGGILIHHNNCKVLNGHFIGSGISSKKFGDGYGILLSGAANCQVLNNTFDKISGINVLLLNSGATGCTKCVINGNTIIEPAMDRAIVQDAAGVMIGYSGNGYSHTDNSVCYNTIDGNENLAHGVAIIGHASGTNISHNNVKNCLRYGILAYNSIYTPITLKNTTINYNKVDNIGNRKSASPYGMGIYLMQSHYSTVKGNTVSNTLINTDNSETLPSGAIALNFSTYANVDSNVITDSHKYGISMALGFNSKITNNTIDKTIESGIYLINSNDVLVQKNTLRNIGKYNIKGFFQHTSRPSSNAINIDKYKNSSTGQSIDIEDNDFYSDNDKAISITGEKGDDAKNIRGNKTQNVNISKNNFHMKRHAVDFIHLDQQDNGTNKVLDNKITP